ncbi:MAG TPA: T9SS type A sorting domain-containing protein [Sunxiuqinia sp.]|nr:T9SS type A sorting domain-containing protein [Sunxiuqinia sp.]
MKIKLLIFFLILSTNCFAQLTVDAGKDTTYCLGMYPHDMILGSDASIKNGVEPYTIAWEANVPLWSKKYTASDFLSDTTLLTPKLKSSATGSNWTTFILHVTDSENQTASDSIRVRFSSYVYLTGYSVYELDKGDSILFHEASVDGGIGPLTYRWQPTIGLSNPDSLVTWCFTDSLTEWWTQYDVIATDSCGCESAPNLVYEIRVNPSLNIVQKGTTVYFDNPDNQLAQITLHSMDGREIGQFETTDNNFNTFQILQDDGIYLITISLGTLTKTEKIIINNELLSSNNQWSVSDDFEYVHVHPDDPYSYTQSTWYKIGADTTIHEIGYKKLMQSTDPNHESWQPEGHFLRQDGEKIFSKDSTNPETLLYDFGLAIGDSMESEIHHPGPTYVSVLDSVKDTILNNSTRKIYYLTEFPKSDPGWKTQEIWIDGIGSITDGLLRQTFLGYTPSSHNYQLVCFHQSGNLIYQSSDFDNCYFDITDDVSEQRTDSDVFKLFPNPTSGRLTVVINHVIPNDAQLEILSIAGKRIRVKTDLQERQSTLDLSGLSPGVYFIRLKLRDQVQTKKLIIR